jgi:hypothetical protein
MGSLTVLPTTDISEDSYHPLVLRRQLRLVADHAVWIIYNKPVLMHIAYAPDPESAIWKPAHTITINASAPFRISSPEAITIEPLCKLDFAFAKRYIDLPADLKIHILTPLLIPPAKTPPPWIQSKLVPAIDYQLWKIPLTKWTLFHYLHSSKGIACVVL